MRDVRRWIVQKVYCEPQLWVLEQVHNLYFPLGFIFVEIFQKVGEKVEAIWLKGLASSSSVLVKTQGSDLKKRGKGHQWVFV